MIKSITLENFFSFAEETTIELNPGLNVLVGINGSGKSNFMRAIRLLYEGVAEDGIGIQELIQNIWDGFPHLLNSNGSNKRKVRLVYHFDWDKVLSPQAKLALITAVDLKYEIELIGIGQRDFQIKESAYWVVKPGGDEKDSFQLMEMQSGKGQLWVSKNGKGNWVRYPAEDNDLSFKSDQLVLRQISDPSLHSSLFSLKLAIETMAIYGYFDTSENSDLRSLGKYNLERKLVKEGKNLISVLNRIKIHSPLFYDRIEEHLKSINPQFKDISFEVLGNDILMVLREKNLSKSIFVKHISDGTLRFILLLSVFYNPERGAVISLDEPEIGLHPDMILTISKAMREASSETQFIIATHSPLLLNAFELDEILVFEKDKDNKTIAKRLNPEDYAEDGQLNLPGFLWLQGRIGGKRW